MRLLREQTAAIKDLNTDIKCALCDNLRAMEKQPFLHKSHTRIDGWYPQREQKKSYPWSVRASKWRYAFLNTLSHTSIFSVLRITVAVLPTAVFSWKKDGQTRTVNHEIVETSLNYRHSMDILLSPFKKFYQLTSLLSITPYHQSKHW